MTGFWRRALAVLASLALALSLLELPLAGAADGRLRLLGEHSFPSGRTFQGTTVGGLSGIAYDGQRNVFYAVSDDRGDLQAPRFYTLEIDVGPGGIADVRIVGVTTLDSDSQRAGIQPYERGAVDLEEVVLTPERELIISSERDQQGRPWIRRFALDGSLLGDLPVPERFLPESQTGSDGRPVLVRGVRNNLGFEALALSLDGRSLWVANEEALAQDGPIATLAEGTMVRVLRYSRGPGGWDPVDEVPLRTEPIFSAPQPPTEFADNGVSAMLAAGHFWRDFDLLVMERSYANAVGTDVSIFGVRLTVATQTATLPALPIPYTGPLSSKTLLVRMADIGVKADNLEGMTYGPRLPNGKPSLILISDDNFSNAGPPQPQTNQFLLFELNEVAAETVAPPPLPPGSPPAPTPAAGVARPAVPSQVPAALPRTGTLGVGAPLAILGAMLVGVGMALRRLARRTRV